MIYQPRSIQPTWKAVDADSNAQISMIVNTNNYINAYRLTIFNLDNTIKYQGEKTNFDENIYNGEACFIELPMSELTNGEDYKWIARLYQPTTDMLITYGAVIEPNTYVYTVGSGGLNQGSYCFISGDYAYVFDTMFDLVEGDTLTFDDTDQTVTLIKSSSSSEYYLSSTKVIIGNFATLTGTMSGDTYTYTVGADSLDAGDYSFTVNGKEYWFTTLSSLSPNDTIELDTTTEKITQTHIQAGGNIVLSLLYVGGIPLSASKSENTTTSVFLKRNINIKKDMYLKIGNESLQITNYDVNTGIATVDGGFSNVPSANDDYYVYSDFIETTPENILYVRKTPVVTIENKYPLTKTRSGIEIEVYKSENPLDLVYAKFSGYLNQEGTPSPSSPKTISPAVGTVVLESMGESSSIVSNIEYDLGDNFLSDKDYIENGTLHKLTGFSLLDGSLNWTNHATQEDGYYKAYTEDLALGTTVNFEESTFAKCTHFEVANSLEEFNGDAAYIGFTNEATYISIPSSLASTAAELKTWLSNNNVGVFYNLQEEETINLDKTGEIEFYDPVSTISNSLSTNTEIKFSYSNIVGGIETLTRKSTTFIGNYIAENDTPLVYYIWNLYSITNEKMNLVKTSGKVYKADISFEYDGFKNGETYILSLSCENEFGAISTAKTTFYVSYEEVIYDEQPTAVQTEEEGIKVSWLTTISTEPYTLSTNDAYGYVQSNNNTKNSLWLETGQRINRNAVIVVGEVAAQAIIDNYNSSTGYTTLSTPLSYVPENGDYYYILSEPNYALSNIDLMYNNPYNGVNSAKLENARLIYEKDSGMAPWPEDYQLTMQFLLDTDFFYGENNYYQNIIPIARYEGNESDGSEQILVFAHGYNFAAITPAMNDGSWIKGVITSIETDRRYINVEPIDIDLMSQRFFSIDEDSYLCYIQAYDSETHQIVLDYPLPENIDIEGGETFSLYQSVEVAYYDSVNNVFCLQENNIVNPYYDYIWSDSQYWNDSLYWVEGGTQIERAANTWWKLQIKKNSIILSRGGV